MMIGQPITALTAGGSYLFTVKERGDGEPFIVAELRKGYDLPALENGFISFTLRPGTTIEQATDLAATMRSMIDGMSHTLFLVEPSSE